MVPGGEPNDMPTMYLLFFEEAYFASSAHYQSIRPTITFPSHTPTPPTTPPITNSSPQFIHRARACIVTLPDATSEMTGCIPASSPIDQNNGVFRITDSTSAKSGEKIVNSRERSYMNTKNVIAGTRTRRKRTYFNEI